jgi:hypothetical protein
MDFGAVFDDENDRSDTRQAAPHDSWAILIGLEALTAEQQKDIGFLFEEIKRVSVLELKVERLDSTVKTLEDILDNSDKKAIRITTRRYQVSEFMRFIGMTALGFTAVLFVGSTLSGDRLQKDEYAQTAVLAGLTAVTAMSIGFNLQD